MSILLRMAAVGVGVYLGRKIYKELRICHFENVIEAELEEQERKKEIEDYLASKEDMILRIRKENSAFVSAVNEQLVN